ncbi:hypothetical protein [Alloactinosynnema sp. L-07]|uniref:hypothetical protein n=1 Tax=Alloactinosynnema sp. L-07 TaxID=1653480 RepID=UPI0006B676C3|nr:hypothetical protein [Alloactinosynnema sp. L-07]
MKSLTRAGLVVVLAATTLSFQTGTASADAPSGAIFTTLADGTEVNFNHFDAKPDVYLDGGPGPGAPQHAAGLDDGTYVYQVTDPSGKVLLSTDPARCRQFVVTAGIISGVVDTDCEHVTGLDVDHGATTVQLFPFLDTPNNGGVYKVWATRVGDFLAGCAELGVANGLNVVDCGNAPGNRHGFVPADSKTDNFKVDEDVIIEIDTRFYRPGDPNLIDGLAVTWTDTNGASNRKWSYYAPQLDVNHEAHVEAVEAGTHRISVAHQPGCQVLAIDHGHKHVNGAGSVDVKITNLGRSATIFIDVLCA